MGEWKDVEKVIPQYLHFVEGAVLQGTLLSREQYTTANGAAYRYRILLTAECVGKVGSELTKLPAGTLALLSECASLAQLQSYVGRPIEIRLTCLGKVPTTKGNRVWDFNIQAREIEDYNENAVPF